MDGKRVAVLGAGIMGCSTALYLARSGYQVTLFDQAPQPFCGASRWNEGKIHLGFLYAADPSFRTASRLLPGGLAFKPLVEDLLGCELQHCTESDDIYLVHRDSVLDVATTRRYFNRLAELIRRSEGAACYLIDASAGEVSQLSESELAEVADPESILAGFSVPERSVSTNWLADRFVDAVTSSPEIEARVHSRITGLHRQSGKGKDMIQVRIADGSWESYSTVVNCLWEGRPAIDASFGIEVRRPISHRYRVSLFIGTNRPVRSQSAVICTGPFGDVKNYGGSEFYMSWYPAGLLCEGEDIVPPDPTNLRCSDRSGIAEEVFDALSHHLKGIDDIRAHAKSIQVEGGWVYAQGEGMLDDPRATLHRRDRIGVSSNGSYYSVDTGKYSIAPWLASGICAQITGRCDSSTPSRAIMEFAP